MSAVPTPYTRAYDFNSFQVNNPNTPLPGIQVDTELNRVKTSLDTTQARLSEIQRDDGDLRNGIVTTDSLSPDIYSLFALAGANIRGQWLPSTSYLVKDLVTNAGVSYVATVNHTSAPSFITDLGSGKWIAISQGIPLFTFADNTERDASIPINLGQLGVQLDTSAIYIATGFSAGNWTAYKPSDGSIVTSMLNNGLLSADTNGRNKMADGYLTLAKIAAAIFTADTDGRSKFASGFVSPDLAQAGLWKAIAPAGSVLQTLVVEEATNFILAGSPSNLIIPQDDSIPQIGEGTAVVNLSITIQAGSKILIDWSWQGSPTSDSTMAWAFFENSNANAIYASQASETGGRSRSSSSFYLWAPAGGAGGTFNIQVRMGPSTNVTWRLNGSTSGRTYGGASKCTLKLQEIK